MRVEEWGPITAFMENAWKDEFDDGRFVAYWKALGHLPAEVVDAAVTALAGGRAITCPPVSAAGAYLPSSETIARECAAQGYIGTWGWASTQIANWIEAARVAKYRRSGTYELADSDLTQELRYELLTVHEQHGRKLVGLVESFGLGEVCRRYAASVGWWREARHRWDHLALEPGPARRRLLGS